MSNQRSDTSNSGGPFKADDLKLINGIGPSIEERLNDAGIVTFAQLAALSPADIAAAVFGISDLTSEYIKSRQSPDNNDMRFSLQKSSSGVPYDRASPAQEIQGHDQFWRKPSRTRLEPSLRRGLERIIKQDWIGQARKLAMPSAGNGPGGDKRVRHLAADLYVPGQKDAAEIPGEIQHSTNRVLGKLQEETMTSVDSPRYATFTVELLLSANNEALRTHIEHRESGDEETWNHWRDAELLSFLTRHARLGQPQQRSSLPGAQQLASTSHITKENERPVPPQEEVIPPVAEEPSPQSTIASQPISTLYVRELKVIERDTATHRNALPSLESFDVQLTVDLTGQAELIGKLLEYRIYIYAKRQEDRTRHIIAEAQGSFTAGESVTITAAGKKIPQGMYRLWAKTVLLSTDKATTQSILSVAHAKGVGLLIY